MPDKWDQFAEGPTSASASASPSVDKWEQFAQPDAKSQAPTENPITAPLSKATSIGPAPGILDRLRAGQVPGLDEFEAGRQSAGNPVPGTTGLAPPPTLAGRAGQMAGVLTKGPAAQALTGTMAPEVESPIPSAARAGRKFEDVLAAAKDVPIAPGGPVTAAMRGKELASRGGTLPKVLRDFVRRSSDVDAPPITYQEARDFYTNSRLAMSEYLATKPNMWRQVTVFKNALDEAVEGAANTVGKAADYRDAMTEYAHAMKMKNLVKAAAKIGIPLVLGYKLNKMIGALAKAE